MIALALALLLSATPQTQEAPVPPACIGATFVSWEACAEAAREGTPAYSLAMGISTRLGAGTSHCRSSDRVSRTARDRRV